MDHDIIDALRCPRCRGALIVDERAARCAGCEGIHPVVDGQLDLRPLEPFDVSLPVPVGTAGPELGDHGTRVLERCPASEVELDGVEVPHHLTIELLSWLPAPRRDDAVVLDLGCGASQNRPVLEGVGYRYVGVDYRDPSAAALVDAHRLPFDDATFDLVVSIAVLEHLHAPVLAMAEVRRILRPGGRVLGTVAFQEPYHDRSYYNHTALGVVNTLATAGLEVELVAAQPGYSLLDAGSKVLFNGAPTVLKRVLAWPTKLLHRLWWRAVPILRRSGDYSAHRRLALTAGTWVFRGRVLDREA